MGPAPAVAEIRRAVRPFLDSAGLVVACSGGADSLALAAALAFHVHRIDAPVPIALVTIDHGLQDGSAQQAQRVATWGHELGYDVVETVRVDVGTAGGREAAARSARYAALDAVRDGLGYRTILLGHTLDDQAETVLLGLGRGSGGRSIAGMRPRSGHYGRPLLGVRRATTVAACRALGLEFWDDPHNLDPSFQRVRLRTEVLPLLEDVLQGGVAGALARTASQLQDDQDALAGLATATLGIVGLGDLDVAVLEVMPRAVRTRAMREWALARGAAEVTSTHVARLDELVTNWHGQRAVDLPGGVRVRRRSARLVLEPPQQLEKTLE